MILVMTFIISKKAKNTTESEYIQILKFRDDVKMTDDDACNDILLSDDYTEEEQKTIISEALSELSEMRKQKNKDQLKDKKAPEEK